MSEPIAEPGGDELDLASQYGEPEDTAAEPEAADPAEGGEPGEPTPSGFAVTPEMQAWFDQEWEARQQAVAANLQPQPYEQQQTETASQAVVFDPFADNAGEQLQALLANERQQTVAEVTQALAPILQTYQQQQDAEGMERAKDIASDVMKRNDIEGLNVDKVVQAANLFTGEATQRYGATPRAAEYAIEKAVRFIHEEREAARKEGEEQYKNRLATLADAPREVEGAGAVATGAVDDVKGADEMAFFSRNYTALVPRK